MPAGEPGAVPSSFTRGRLTEAEAAERNAILIETDVNACQASGTRPGQGAADDPGWLVETVTEPDDKTLYVIIRCPACRPRSDP